MQDSRLSIIIFLGIWLVAACKDAETDGIPSRAPIHQPAGRMGCQLTFFDSNWPGPNNFADWSGPAAISFVEQNFSCQTPDPTSVTKKWTEVFLVNRTHLRDLLVWTAPDGSTFVPLISDIDDELDAGTSAWSNVSGTELDFLWEEPFFEDDAVLDPEDGLSVIGVAAHSSSNMVPAEMDHHFCAIPDPNNPPSTPCDPDNLSADIFIFETFLDGSQVFWGLDSNNSVDGPSFTTTLIHELGHATGQDHTDNLGSVMTEAIEVGVGVNFSVTITTDDSTTQRFLYPL